MTNGKKSVRHFFLRVKMRCRRDKEYTSSIRNDKNDVQFWPLGSFFVIDVFLSSRGL